ncbi:hypothetical protein P9314_03000 [Paenibacillus validus]|uniref:hypothetical protein n=1 Tax=Paenibacillus validus TaxID=44253 RepID=UPI000FD76933|nr:hypothetical protein [Paenibacillus validus]MED4599672.1 hypothetical protein [Paenibacillus validus]MED4604895.1 hypothetical protein [Paenibacillus validus]
MSKIIDYDDSPYQVQELLSSDKPFEQYSTILHCIFNGWMDLYEREDGSYYVATRVSSHSAEHPDEILKRMHNALYGSDAVFLKCLEKGYLDLVPNDDTKMWWLFK